jgi:hypothetical protein
MPKENNNKSLENWLWDAALSIRFNRRNFNFAKVKRG